MRLGWCLWEDRVMGRGVERGRRYGGEGVGWEIELRWMSWRGTMGRMRWQRRRARRRSERNERMSERWSRREEI